MTALPRTSAAGPDRALRSLPLYLGGLVLACVLVQVVIGATGGAVGLLAAALTVVVALGAAAYLAVFGRGLGQIRFGLLVAHAVLYVCVTGSFAAHAALRAATGADLDPSWGGPVLAMPAIWGLGVLVHAAGSLAGRGFEAPRA